MSRFLTISALLLAVLTVASAGVVRQAPSTTPAPTTSAANKSNTTANASKSSNGTNGTNTTNSSSSCFPADATVTTYNGAVKRMDELIAGDRVAVGRGQFSEVFMFTHKSSAVRSEFVVLTAQASGATLRLSPGHYLYVNGALKAAADVVLGDSIELANGELDTVAKRNTAVFDGLFNPQTLQGDIVVDGVRASTYTTAVQPALAHAALSPLRAAYRVLGWSSASLNEGSDFANMMPAGPSVC